MSQFGFIDENASLDLDLKFRLEGIEDLNAAVEAFHAAVKEVAYERARKAKEAADKKMRGEVNA